MAEKATMSDIKRCVIITGMSGSGKSTALRILEDMGFFPIDNIPPAALPQVLDLLRSHDSATLHGVVAVTDARGGALLEGFEDVVTRLRSYIPMIKVIFLDASDDSLVRRYEQTRRRHPMGAELALSEAIAKERKTLAPIREIADMVVDTTELSIQDLRNMLLAALAMDQAQPTVIISSFGYKYGIPSDSDFVFDVRFLENPFYVPQLRHLSGKDEAVQDYLLKAPGTIDFMKRCIDLITFSLPLYRYTGKIQVHIAFGCTGGRHRSVAIAEWLAKHFLERGEKCFVNHRDIEKEAGRT
jgi:UPF0042 nucleotide-binding protein